MLIVSILVIVESRFESTTNTLILLDKISLCNLPEMEEPIDANVIALKEILVIYTSHSRILIMQQSMVELVQSIPDENNFRSFQSNCSLLST